MKHSIAFILSLGAHQRSAAFAAHLAAGAPHSLSNLQSRAEAIVGNDSPQRVFSHRYKNHQLSRDPNSRSPCSSQHQLVKNSWPEDKLPRTSYLSLTKTCHWLFDTNDVVLNIVNRDQGMKLSFLYYRTYKQIKFKNRLLSHIHNGCH